MPNPTTSAPTRRKLTWIAATLLLIATLFGVGLFLRDLHNRVSVISGCSFDDLLHIQIAIERTAELPEERFPDRNGIDPRFDPTLDGYGFVCRKSGQPYVWNARITEYSRNSPGVIPLVWCPDGAHGRHRGVVVLRDGQLDTDEFTETEFRNMLEGAKQVPSRKAE